MIQSTIDQIALAIYPTMLERYYKVTDKLTVSQKEKQNLTIKSPAIWAIAHARTFINEIELVTV